MFSVPHIIIFIFSLAVSILLAIYLAKKIKWDQRVLYGCLAICVMSEVIRTFFFMQSTSNGYYMPVENLPLNLCSIQIILIVIITFTKNQKVKDVLVSFMYPTCIGGAFMALLIPTSPIEYGFFSIISFQYFVYHAMLVFLSIYMFLAKAIDFKLKSYFISILTMLGFFFGSLYLNSLFGYLNNTNFFFVVRPPMEDLPILNVNHGWYVYILNLAWIGLLLITLAYIPVIIKAIKTRRSELPE